MLAFIRGTTFRIVLLFATALAIIGGSLWYSNSLVRQLAQEEARRIELFAQAQEFVGNAGPEEDNCEGVTFLFKNVIGDNRFIPTVITDSNRKIIFAANLGLPAGLSAEDSVRRTEDWLHARLDHPPLAPIRIESYGQVNYIYYDESAPLQRLRSYPWLSLLVIVVFLGVVLGSYWIARRSEENKVWAGMAKETAHQLGTPVSSLMAMVELLRDRLEQDPQDGDAELIEDLEKDANRLAIIAERFSKIGSKPELQPVEAAALLQKAAEYVSKRMSRRIDLVMDNRIPPGTMVHINAPLFEWVIENLLKNALDAIPGQGTITLRAEARVKDIVIEVQDTGKGIPRHLFKQVFKPGFTTKKRGWGLGLSLSRRIIEQYHKGSIYVKWSEVEKGTIFRIELPR